MIDLQFRSEQLIFQIKSLSAFPWEFLADMMQQNTEYLSITAIIYSLLLRLGLVSLTVTIKVSREYILPLRPEVCDRAAHSADNFQLNISL